MNYIEVTFDLDPLIAAREIIIAELGELGFESFVNTKTGVQCYVRKDDFHIADLDELSALQMPNQKVTWSVKEIEDENWNAKWESQFDPIPVGEQCLIRATFHEAQPEFPLEVIINPQMSFGTGHHATTYLIVDYLMHREVAGLDVLDMGCGTGVLGIVAALKGAKHIDGIDIDHWSVENAIENCGLNNVTNMQVIEGDAQFIPGQYDLVLANINRNILTADMPLYFSAMKPGASIVFSGFFDVDEPVIKASAEDVGLSFDRSVHRGEWAMMVFTK